MKQQFSPQQKAAVAVAAIKGEKNSNEIASEYQVHPIQVGLWKKRALEGMEKIFSDKRQKDHWEKDRIIDELYKTLGRRDLELAWLKKKVEPFGTSG